MIPGTPDADLQCITPLVVEAVYGRAGPRFEQIPNVAELISDWATQIHADTARRKVSSVGQCPDSLHEFPCLRNAPEVVIFAYRDGSDLDRLTALVLDDLVALPGIAYARTSLVTALHFEGAAGAGRSRPQENHSRVRRAPRHAEAMRSLDRAFHLISLAMDLTSILTTIWVGPPKCA